MPKDQTAMILAGVGIAVVCCCCVSSALAYNRNGNINIFSSSGGISLDDMAYAKGFGAAPGSSSNLLSQYGSSDCVLGPWGSWSPCSPKCGDGHMTRTRPIAQPPTGNGTCVFPTTETQVCTGEPACQTDQIAGQYLPCPNGMTITGASCMGQGTPITDAQCEHLKQQAALGAVSFGATGTPVQAEGEIAAYVVGGPMAVGIGAAVAVADIDCDALYVCPAGSRDTKVNKMCDLDATPKCPEGYRWDNTAKRCQFINP